MLLATNRQKKVLRFFSIDFSINITHGKAGLEIDKIKQIPEKWNKWEKYCFLTNDFSQDNDQLKEFDKSKLKKVQLPNNWNLQEMKQNYIETKVKQQLEDEPTHSPLDNPQPNIEFKKRKFVLSGNFLYGNKKECENEIIKRGGAISKSISPKTDYLILGSKGNSSYKYGEYGSKVVKAMDLRSNYGVPAIISEEYWESKL